jgi:acetamidase/formamidase
MTITVRLKTLKHQTISFPQYRIPPGQLARYEHSGYHVCTGIDADLTEAAKQATRATIDHIETTHGIDRETAYAIASVAVDLRIHELVDAPNWVVGAFLPDSIFTEPSS